MTNKEQKKINDKKYIRKNVIVALIGVMIFAILICTIQPKALTYYDWADIPRNRFNRNIHEEYYEYYAVSDWHFYLDGGMLEFYFIAKGNIDTHNVVTLRDGQSMSHIVDTVANITNNPYFEWNLYKALTPPDLPQGVTSVNIFLPHDCELDNAYFVISNAVDYEGIMNVINSRVDQLNAPQYATYCTKINNRVVEDFSTNEPFIYDREVNQIYGDTLVVEGCVALTDGVSAYSVTLNNIRYGEYPNKATSDVIPQEFIYYIENANIGIDNYNRNAVYKLEIPLSDFIGDVVSVSISAINTSGRYATILVIPVVHVLANESETEIETDIIEDNDEAYIQGYRDALHEMAKSPLFNAEVTGTVVIEQNGSVITTSNIQHTISNLTLLGGFQFSNIKPLVDIIKTNNPDSTVYLSQLTITFNRPIVFTNELIFFGTQKPIMAIGDGGNDNTYVGMYNPSITVKGNFDTGLYKEFEAFYYTVLPDGNIFGFRDPFLYTMRITDTNFAGQITKISFSDMIIDTNTQFFESIIYIPYESYIELSDMYLLGNSVAYDRGYADGIQSTSNISYKEGVKDGKKQIDKEQYDKGYKAGIDSGQSLRNVVLAPIDGISGMFHNMLDVNILGFQLDDIIGAFLLMLLVIWIGKKVL